MKINLDTVFEDLAMPNILVVGCGNIGSQIVKSYVDSDLSAKSKVYITDSDKDKARRLSEYRLSSITPIKFKSAKDTPDDVDVIVVAVDFESEHKILERLVESGRAFISLTDSSKVADQYYELEEDFIAGGVNAILGTGLVPGLSDVLAEKCIENLDQVLDISLQRLGFVSKASLSSVKNSLKEQPLRVIDGCLEEIKGQSGSQIFWFPPPWGSTECHPVGVGVKALKDRYKSVHNISVKYAEPKLPTFRERVENIFLKTPMTTTQACIRAQAYGLKDDQLVTNVRAVIGDAMSMIVATSIISVVGISRVDSVLDANKKSFYGVNEVIGTNQYLNVLYNLGCDILKFDP